jgi:hypothetical protein
VANGGKLILVEFLYRYSDNMSSNFQKIYNAKIDINTDDILSKIEKTVVSQNISGNVLKDDTGIPFWQKYKSNICFARNFYTTFSKECEIVAHTLNNIKNELSDTNNPSYMLSLFLNSAIIPKRVNLIKIPCGVTVDPHTDLNRKICVNIGLKNSNSATTYVSDYEEKDFWNNPTEDYQMEDGDMYLLNVEKTHAVKSIVSKDSNLDRYIITYNLLNR